MNEKAKNYLWSALSILLVAAVLVFIVAGLSHIGLLELPGALFGQDDKSGTPSVDEELTDILEGASELTELTVLRANMTPESVRAMLSELKPAESYMQELEYTVYAQGVGSMRRVVILMRPGAKLAYYVTPGTGAYRQIFEKDGSTSVSVRSGGKVQSRVYATGDISFEGEVGVVLTHEDFLKSVGEDGYTYSLLSGDVGTLMLITFTTQSGTYSQTQTYKLNLDYGVVTEVTCYENGRLIYSMNTTTLSKDGKPDFTIPGGFLELLPEELRWDADTVDADTKIE